MNNARTHISNISSYISHKRDSSSFFLDMNENPSNNMTWKNYNDDCSLLQKSIKNILKIDSLMLLRGSDEGISLLIRTFVEPQKESILIFEPTFSMYRIIAMQENVEVINAPRNFIENPSDTLTLIKEKKIKMIFLCNPNNPTGESFSRNSLLKILNYLPSSVLLVIDEAYIEFSEEESSLPLIKEYHNLFILRTFSKYYGLASLRIGALCTSFSHLFYLEKMILPFRWPEIIIKESLKYLNSPEHHKKCQTYAEDVSQIKRTFENYLRNKRWISFVYSSQGNFLCFESLDGKDFYEFLKEKGFLVKYLCYLGKNLIRISIGNLENMKLLQKTIEDFKI